jgi:hypothetical protein
MSGAAWALELLEHRGEKPDTMPQAIRATDTAGRSCIYVPITVDHDVVDSLGFELRREPEVQKPGLRLVPKENGAA